MNRDQLAKLEGEHSPNVGRTDGVSRWLPISTVPRDGSFILLAGPSGYGTTPLRVEVCRWWPEYHPYSPWVNHSNDDWTDGGGEPTHWMPLPPLPPLI